jgi:hypothetical protein
MTRHPGLACDGRLDRAVRQGIEIEASKVGRLDGRWIEVELGRLNDLILLQVPCAVERV